MKRNKLNLDDELELSMIYHKLFDVMVDLVLETEKPEVVASTMISQALRLYKTVLKYEGEFEEIVNTILKQAKETEPFENKVLH